MRAAQQDDFDRVVFEFEGPIPGYRVEYLKSRGYTTKADQSVSSSPENVFIFVDFDPIPVDEKQLAVSQAKGFLPTGEQRMPSLMAIEEKGDFEGSYDFCLV